MQETALPGGYAWEPFKNFGEESLATNRQFLKSTMRRVSEDTLRLACKIL